MSIKVKCPGCTKMLTVPDAARGKAVKCPSCETRVSIPGDDETAGKVAAGKPKAKKAKKPAPIDDESGLASLDLGKVADHEANVCPKCGYDLDLAAEDEDDEVTECPKCGWDVAEGGLGAKARKKALKGPDPDKYYPGLWKNSWTFVGINLMLVIRTFIYIFIASLLLWGSTLAYLYFSMLPPRYMAFAPMAFVSAMVIPGWLWYLDTEVIKLTLERRDRFKRINFDFFLAGALGVKFVIWNIVFAGPLLLIPGVVGWVLYQFAGMPWWIIPLVLGVSYIPIFGLWPVTLTHMTMPIEAPGWMIWKVVPQALRTFKPLSWWFALFAATTFPIILIMGLTLFFTGAKFLEFVEIMETDAAINRLQARVDSVGTAKNPPADLVQPEAITEFSLLDDFQLTQWHKREGDEIHLFEAVFDYTDKDKEPRTYYSQVRGKLDRHLVGPNSSVAKGAPTASLTTYEVGTPHYIALGATAFAWLICLVILSVTSLFNMRTNGWFAYYFRDRLDLQMLTKEYKYVAKIPREHEKKVKTTGDFVAESAIAALIIDIIGVIIGMIYGALNAEFGIVNGLVAGAYWGALAAGIAAFIGLIIAAFQVTPVWGLLVFFSPCMLGVPNIMFLIKEWEDGKKHFFQGLFAALVVMLMTPIMIMMEILPFMDQLGIKPAQNQQGPANPGAPGGGVPGGGGPGGGVPGGPGGGVPGGPGGAAPGGAPGAPMP